MWCDIDLIHVLISGVRVKTVRSHLSAADLTALAARGARLAGPSPLPPREPGEAVEVERTVNAVGSVPLAGRQILAAEILGGRGVGIRIDASTLMFYDPATGELLRTRPNPLAPEEVERLRGQRPSGPVPRPSQEPVRVQRWASNTGIVMGVGQKIALGRIHAHQTVTIHVAEDTLTIDLPDGGTSTVRRTTTTQSGTSRPSAPARSARSCKNADMRKDAGPGSRRRRWPVACSRSGAQVALPPNDQPADRPERTLEQLAFPRLQGALPGQQPTGHAVQHRVPDRPASHPPSEPTNRSGRPRADLHGRAETLAVARRRSLNQLARAGSPQGLTPKVPRPRKVGHVF